MEACQQVVFRANSNMKVKMTFVKLDSRSNITGVYAIDGSNTIEVDELQNGVDPILSSATSSLSLVMSGANANVLISFQGGFYGSHVIVIILM